MGRAGGAVRLLEVAAGAGVSIATASRALSGSPGVSQTVAEQVQAVAARLGYVVNVHAGQTPGVHVDDEAEPGGDRLHLLGDRRAHAW